MTITRVEFLIENKGDLIPQTVSIEDIKPGVSSRYDIEQLGKVTINSDLYGDDTIIFPCNGEEIKKGVRVRHSEVFSDKKHGCVKCNRNSFDATSFEFFLPNELACKAIILRRK